MDKTIPFEYEYHPAIGWHNPRCESHQTRKDHRRGVALFQARMEERPAHPLHPHKHSGRREMRALMESLQKTVTLLPRSRTNRQERRHGTKGWRSKHIW